MRPFETEVELCQRYFEKTYDIDTVIGSSNTWNISPGVNSVISLNSTDFYNYGHTIMKVPKRAISSNITIFSPIGHSNTFFNNNTGANGSTPILYNIGQNAFRVYRSGLTANNGYHYHWSVRGHQGYWDSAGMYENENTAVI